MLSAFAASGFVSTRVGGMTFIGLNTIDMTWGLECNDTAAFNNARAQMQQLSSALATAKFAVISGHVPAGFWRASCRQQYASIVGQYAGVVKQHMFGAYRSRVIDDDGDDGDDCRAHSHATAGHLHSDQFFLVSRNGTMVDQCGSDNTDIAIACAPSVVPSFNPSARVWVRPATWTRFLCASR